MKKYLLPFAAVLLLAGCDATSDNIDINVNTSSSSSMMMDHDMSSEMMMDDEIDMDEMDHSSDGMMQTSSSSKAAVSSSAPSAARVIEMTVEDWKFSQSTINVKKGEKVIVRLTNKSGEHSFTSQDLGINVAIDAGETKDIEIPTDEAGTFSFRCAIPCGPGHMDMKGSIIVS